MKTSWLPASSASGGRLAVYRPAMDVAGRDLLVQLVDSWRTLSVQVKGTARMEGTAIQFLVRRNTFVPSEDFWLAFYFFDASLGSFWKYCWLVPSLEFARLTADQHIAGRIYFRVTVDGENNRWRRFRYEISEQGAVLGKALLRLGQTGPA
jgi:hypothetical protein